MAETKTIEPKHTELQEKDGIKFDELVKQHDDEYRAGDDYMREWKETKRTYLKLYINQRKNPKKVGDTLMFSTHQTILASLYKDRLDTEWLGREEEDEDRAEALNALWEFDYDESDKAQHDYAKYWDACGFGTALEDWSHFDRDTLTPIPTLWDMLQSFLDPEATSINGNRLGQGACRFLGRLIVRTKREMKDHGGFFNIDDLTTDDDKTSDVQRTQQAVSEARGVGSGLPIKLQENQNYLLRQWFTWINGKRYLMEIGNNGRTVVRLQALKSDYWPIVESHVYPDPHSMLPPGCFDFTEDKQRARAIIQNYGLDAAKLDVLPMWLFDKTKIKNKQQLRDWKAGKMIEGQDLNANSIFPLTKPTMHQYVDALMREFETNAQKALATPEIQQGILFQQKRTATEIAEASANVDTRYSLTASLFAHSESNAAYIWFDQYKAKWNDRIDKKTVRVIGAFGPKYIEVKGDTFKFKKDPDVRIESRVVSRARKREQITNMANYGNVLVATPGSNRRYFAKKMGRLMFSKDEVERLLPPTVDELRAEKENESLEQNSLKGVVIEPTDDHVVHLEIHSKAPDTQAKFAHVEAHKKAMLMQRNNPGLFAGLLPNAPQPEQITPAQGPSTPQGQIQELIT